METTNNQNHENHQFGLDLKSVKMPEWLSLYFSPPKICNRPDIDEMLVEGYPQDDEF